MINEIRKKRWGHLVKTIIAMKWIKSEEFENPTIAEHEQWTSLSNVEKLEKNDYCNDYIKKLWHENKILSKITIATFYTHKKNMKKDSLRFWIKLRKRNTKNIFCLKLSFFS